MTIGKLNRVNLLLNVIDFSFVTAMETMMMIIGRFLIGFIYLFAGVSNLYYRSVLIEQMTKRGVPYPKEVFWVGVPSQIIGGLAVIFNVLTVPASILLATFTLLATFMFHNFWDMEGEPYRLNTLKFVTNFGLIGALMLVAYISLL